MSRQRLVLLLGIPVALLSLGCRSPYRSDQGALFGGLMGAGLGAVVGHAVGDPLAGAAIGAGAGAISGAVVGDQLDQVEAQNRAEIEARVGRPISGAVSIDDVIAMTQAGVEEEVIVNHVRIHGALQPLQTGDIIHLKNSGVGPRAIQAMQSPPVERRVVRQAPPHVIVRDHYYDDPWYHHHPCYHHYRPYHHNPHVSIGFSSHH